MIEKKDKGSRMTDLSSGWLILLVFVAIMWFGGITLFLWFGRKSDKTPDELKMMGWAKVLVASAELIYESNTEKFEYVVTELLKQAESMQTVFTETEIRAFVEWAVYWVKKMAIPVNPALPRPDEE